VTSNQLILKQRQEDAEKVWATNYHMPFKLSQHLMSRYLMQARSLQKTGWLGDPAAQPSWCIVNVSSLLAEKGGQGSSTYAASKAALTALTRVLALEGGDLSERSRALMPPLRANAILPGYIDTPMIEGMF
jgi:NAD(P)-dependent dehydrogenase (short-subunit alcohol dehydrogenase family)